MCSIWWDLIIEQFPVELYAELSECDEESLIQILLGKDPSTDLCTFDLENIISALAFDVKLFFS
jgi:hypothetical protein